MCAVSVGAQVRICFAAKGAVLLAERDQRTAARAIGLFAAARRRLDWRMSMIDHIGIRVRDFARSKAFYDAALAPLGMSFLNLLPPEDTDGAKVGGFGAEAACFWIEEDVAQTPPLHVAFRAHNRQDVDAFHAAALSAGGLDNGAPGVRPHYHAAYYGAFVRDPDGHNIEAVCHAPPPESLEGNAA